MKTIFLLLASFLLIFSLSSCAHPRDKRIAANPKLYQSLSSNDQVLVQQGRIREGMTKEAVFLAIGRPDQVASGREKGSSIEKWTYVGTQPVFTNSFFPGYGGWGRGYGYCGGWDPYWAGFNTPNVIYVPYKAATVSFRGNRVVQYMTGPQ
jgi:hypothetical protein